MKQIENFENIEELSSGLEKGIYVLQIRKVKDIVEKQYLEVKFDIFDGPNKGYFARLSNENYDNWSNIGIYRASYKETATKFFKNFITSVQKSNQNYIWNWDENTLVGRLFVGVFDEEEYVNKDGDISTIVKLQSVRSLESMRNGEIKLPGLKKLKKQEEKSEGFDTTFLNALPF